MNDKQLSASHKGKSRLIALMDGRVVGAVYQGPHSRLRFTSKESWRSGDNAYPLSLSMPLTAAEHRHPAVEAYLWGLLPDNEQTLSHYARTLAYPQEIP